MSAAAEMPTPDALPLIKAARTFAVPASLDDVGQRGKTGRAAFFLLIWALTANT
jgi:hypothetical protein